MIDTLLCNIIENQIPTKKCAVLLSGGVDSLSVALAAHNVGKEVIAYSFNRINSFRFFTDEYFT